MDKTKAVTETPQELPAAKPARRTVELSLENSTVQLLLDRLPKHEDKRHFSIDDWTKFVQLGITVLGAVATVYIFLVYGAANQRDQNASLRLQLEKTSLDLSKSKSAHLEPEFSFQVSVLDAPRYAVSLDLSLVNHCDTEITIERNVVTVYIGRTVNSGDAGAVQAITNPPGLASAVDWGPKPAYRSEYLKANNQGGNTGTLRPGEGSSWTYSYVVRSLPGQWLAVRADLTVLESKTDGGVATRNEMILKYCYLTKNNIWSCEREKPTKNAAN